MEKLVEGSIDGSPGDLGECLDLLQEQVCEMHCLRREVAALQIQIRQQILSCRLETTVSDPSAQIVSQRATLRAVWQQISAKPRNRSVTQRWFFWWPVHSSGH
jgi:hypothetical protein